MEGLLGELALAHVELANARDGIVLVDDSGGLALGLGEHNVHKVSRGGDHLNPLEVVQSRHIFGLPFCFLEVERENEGQRENQYTWSFEWPVSPK